MTTTTPSFKPRKPTGTTGRSIKHSYTEDQLQELWDIASQMTVKDRTALCKRFHISYPTLQRKTGNQPAKKEPEPAPSESSSINIDEILIADPDPPPTKLKQLDRQMVLASLKVELQDAQKVVDDVQKRINMIKNLSDDDFHMMANMLAR